MRKLTGAAFQSLDGVMQAPGGAQEDSSGGFAFGGWVFPLSDDKTGATVLDYFSKPFDLLLGRKTYEIFAAYWPFAPADDPIAKAFNATGKHVLSRGRDRLDWANSHPLGSIEDVKKLKESDGPDLLIQGSSTLYPQLLAANLIDRLSIMTFPVILGSGKRLFGSGTPSGAWKLVKNDMSSTGVIMSSYEPDGAVKLGSFDLPEPSAAELKRRARVQREQ